MPAPVSMPRVEPNLGNPGAAGRGAFRARIAELLADAETMIGGV